MYDNTYQSQWLPALFTVKLRDHKGVLTYYL